MARTSKDHDVRMEEFVDTAKKLFNSKGYESTSVDDIVGAMGVAKGLFYYYFESKDALLNVITERLVEDIRVAVSEVVVRDDLTALAKFELLLGVSADIRSKSAAIVHYFHQPRNKQMHFVIEQRSLEFLVPAMESIVDQGVREGIFDTKYPHETALAYLGAASAVGHENIENLGKNDLLHRVRVFQSITERLLGSEPGSFEMYERLARRRLGRPGKVSTKKPRRSKR